MKELKNRKKSKRFEPQMNANKRELKDFLLPRSSRKARRKVKDGTTEITESHERKDEKKKLKKIYPQICADFHRLKELKN